MSDVSDKHRERKTVFVNAEGQKAERIPDLITAQCIDPACGCRFWVESPVDAVHCTKCGRPGVRSGKFRVLEPFAVEEGGRSLFQVEGDDESQTKEKP